MIHPCVFTRRVDDVEAHLDIVGWSVKVNMKGRGGCDTYLELKFRMFQLGLEGNTELLRYCHFYTLIKLFCRFTLSELPFTVTQSVSK